MLFSFICLLQSLFRLIYCCTVSFPSNHPPPIKFKINLLANFLHCDFKHCDSVIKL